jgi:hypothetical protein
MDRKIRDYCKVVYPIPNMNTAVTDYEIRHENYVKLSLNLEQMFYNSTHIITEYYIEWMLQTKFLPNNEGLH